MMIYVVLGMHKSGTTLVSQILHRSGIDMGDGFESGGTYDQGNQWERREAFVVNLGLIGCEEAAYFSLDHYRAVHGPLPPEQAEEMREMVEACQSRGEDWGFKEPLTCLTYPLWRQVLPPHRLVGVYRSPQEVLNHYGAPAYRPDLAWRALRAWSNYNRYLLDAVEHAGDGAILLRYEKLMNGSAEFERLQDFLGRDLVDVRSPGQHRAGSGHPLFGWLDSVMQISGLPRPSAIYRRLESFREAQKDIADSDTGFGQEG